MNSKRSETDVSTRKLILKLICEGKSLRQTGQIVDRSHSTIQKIINNYKNTGTLQNKPRCGRRRKLTVANEKFIIGKMKREPKSSVPKLATEVSAMINISISTETIRRTLRSRGYNGRIATKKLFV